MWHKGILSPAHAGWLSWLEPLPIHQKVAGSIPGQGAYLGCGFDPPIPGGDAYRGN